MKQFLRIGILMSMVLATSAQGQTNPPSQSNAFGKSIGEWLKLYFTWALGGNQADRVGQVRFLPIPDGDYVDGDFTFENPGILRGEATVSYPTGSKFILPIAVWYGEAYQPDADVPANPDPPVPREFFELSIVEVALDGKPLVTEANKMAWYVGPQAFDPPIVYDEPTDYGSIAALFVQGFVTRFGPLTPGTHQVTLRSSLFLPPGGYPNVPDGLGVIFENTWTIHIQAGGK